MKKNFFLMVICFMLLFVSRGGNYHDMHNGFLKNPGLPAFTTHVYFTNEVPVNGIAKESKEFAIKPEGGFAYLVVDNYPNNFTYDQVQVKVYKTVNGAYQSYDNKTYNITTGNYFAYIKYEFYTTGYYTFDVFDKYGTVLGTTSVTINYQVSSGSSSGASGDCISGYKEYYSSSLGFAMCIPVDSYASDNRSSGNDAFTINNFYDKKLDVTFMQEPRDGLDRFDASVIDLTRDLTKSYYNSFYRKEFKLLSSKGDISVYRSVITAILTSGSVLQSSVYYIRMYGKKIRGHDYMVISGPFVPNDSDITYQIIIELGMIGKLKIY